MITPVIIDDNYNSNLRNDNYNIFAFPKLDEVVLVPGDVTPKTWPARFVSGILCFISVLFMAMPLSAPSAKFGFGRKVSHVMTHQVCEDVILDGKTGWEIDIKSCSWRFCFLYCKEGSICITMCFYVLATWNEQYVTLCHCFLAFCQGRWKCHVPNLVWSPSNSAGDTSTTEIEELGCFSRCPDADGGHRGAWREF